MLHHKCACTHCCELSRVFGEQAGPNILSSAALLIKSSPFRLLGISELKHLFKGTQFESVEDIKASVTRVLGAIKK